MAGIGLLALVLLMLQWHYFRLYPVSVHAWAQTDYFSLTKGFLRNDFQFFLPQEFIYNKQFPGEWKIAGSTTITAVNFPIHQYIIALLMKVSGSESPLIFRAYTFLFSLIGLWYLFRTALLLRLSYWQALFLTTIAAFSPVFLFYQANFMVSIPALATAICGTYCYLRYLGEGSSKHWVCAIALLTLAALTRTTFAIPLLAVCGHQLLIAIRSKTFRFRFWLVPSVGFVLIWAYQLYNQYLSATYGSNFLSALQPAADWAQLHAFILQIYENWQADYFSPVQWFVIALVISTLLIRLPRLRKKKVNDPAFFLLIYLTGALCFFLAMSRQFVFHDYYFLDSFFLPLLLLTYYGFGWVVHVLADQRLERVAMGICTFLMVLNGWSALKTRYHEKSNDDVSRTIRAYAQAPQLLAEQGVPEDAKILVLGAYGPNAPFLMMDRTGYSVDHIDSAFFETFRQWDFDYIMTSNFHLREVLIPNFPYVIERLEPIATNFEVTLLRLSEPDPNRNLIDLLLPEQSAFLYSSTTTASSPPDPYWEFTPFVYQPDSLDSPVFRVSPESEFGFKWMFPSHLITGAAHPHIFTLRAKVKTNTPAAPREIDVFGLRDGTGIFFQSVFLNEQLKPTNDWQWITVFCELPAETSPYILGMHYYNAPREELLIDSLKIEIY